MRPLRVEPSSYRRMSLLKGKNVLRNILLFQATKEKLDDSVVFRRIGSDELLAQDAK
jgi:hypothetical protein